jgi:uncharacterized protein
VTVPPSDSSDRIDYQRFVQDALRDVVRRVLGHVAVSGLPDPHCLYIGFRTTAPGVEIPPFLRDQYPEEMTIVLQHQFWGLEVGEEDFSVSLTFNAVRHRLTVPFDALTTFVDPPAEFGLRFDGSPAPPPEPPAPEPPREHDGNSRPTGEVVPFGPRKKRS